MSPRAQSGWQIEDLARLSAMIELRISALRADGSRSDATPIWVVVSADEVYVRTWIRRTTGWYGRAVRHGRAWIDLGTDVEVEVTAVGDVDRAAIDEAYRAKYSGVGARSVTTDEAASSTLRLRPA
jgi:hypothetical protein